MKTVLSLFLISLIFSCKFERVIAQKRFEVPGSRMSINIPKNSLTSPHFSVITVENAFEMSLIEFNGDFESQIKELDSAAYVRGGLKVYSEFQMEVDGYTGKVIHAYSNPAADIVQFLFGDSTFFVMASTLYSRGDKELYNQILNYYKSIKVDRKKKVDWNDFLAFKYDVNNPFKFSSKIAAPLLLQFTKTSDKADSLQSVIISLQFPNFGMFQNDEVFLTHSLSSSIFQLYEDIDEIITEKKILVNGKSAREFKAYFVNQKGERHLIHCLARLTNELGVIVIATVKNGKDEEDVNHFFKGIHFKN